MDSTVATATTNKAERKNAPSKRETTMIRQGGKRLKQTLYITENTRETLEQFSHLHGLNLSEAAEALMLLGLQDTKSVGQAELITGAVRHEMARQYNRFAKLSAMAALEAGTAKELVQSVYWYLLLGEYANYEASLQQDETPTLTDFESLFKLPADSIQGKIIGTMMKKRTDQARFKSVKSLRSGLAILQEILDEMEKDAA